MENQLETNTVMYGKMMAHERWTIYFKMSSTPGCSLEAVPEISLIESIAPLLKAKQASQEKFFSHHHRQTCEEKTFPQQSGDSSTDEEAFADSESDASLSGGDTSLAPLTYCPQLTSLSYSNVVILLLLMCTLQLENVKSLLRSWLVDQMRIKTLKSVFWRGQEKIKMDLLFQKWKTSLHWQKRY